MKKFYRSQLATIVWDSKNNCILADFKKGYFTTADKRVIKILTELGYPEVDLSSNEPPEGLVVSEQVTITDNVLSQSGKVETEIVIKKPKVKEIRKPKIRKSEAKETKKKPKKRVIKRITF